MKSVIRVVIALAVAAPAITLAQAVPQPLTRAQVRADLVQAEKAGYGPTAWAYFPEGEMQAAEFHKAVHQAAAGGYGADWNGVAQAGAIAR